MNIFKEVKNPERPYIQRLGLAALIMIPMMVGFHFLMPMLLG